MKDFLRRAAYVCLRLFHGLRAWLAVPLHFCSFALSLVFLSTILSWLFLDRTREIVLFFPDAQTRSLRGELRSVPRTWSNEARAELVASELLLGPTGLSLMPAISPVCRPTSTLYRKGRIYVDLPPEAAFAESDKDIAALKTGLVALEKSLRAAFPFAKRLVITIGGQEPFLDPPIN